MADERRAGDLGVQRTAARELLHPTFGGGESPSKGRIILPLTCVLHVYTRCMSKVRTNIEIEDVYVRTIMDRYRVRTKTEAVDLALRHLAGQPMTREEALAMEGAHALAEPPGDAGPNDLE